MSYSHCSGRQKGLALGALAAGFLFVASAAVMITGCDKAQSGKPYSPGEVLAQFRADLGEARIREIIKSLDATVKDTIPQQNVYVLSLLHSVPVESVVEKLKKIEGVTWAEPNYRYDISFFPESIAFAEEGDYDLGIPSPSTKPVVVAVIDTGVNPDHPALAGKVIEGFNYYNNTPDAGGSARGTGYHGTASAGRVLDGSGGADIRIMPLQTNDGVGRWLSGSAILKSIYHAVDRGADVISMSFGSSSYSPLMQQALDYAHSKGVVLVASAGNSGNNLPQYPAAYNHVIAVGAANQQGKLAGFSNFGSYIDLVAPGWGVKGLSWNGEQKVNGTSFSAPFIAGMAGLLKKHFSDLTPEGLEAKLKSLARSIDGLNPDRAGQMGAGFIGLEELEKLVKAIKKGVSRLVDGLIPDEPAAPAPVGADSWLARGTTTAGTTFVLKTDGSVVKQD